MLLFYQIVFIVSIIMGNELLSLPLFACSKTTLEKRYGLDHDYYMILQILPDS